MQCSLSLSLPADPYELRHSDAGCGRTLLGEALKSDAPGLAHSTILIMAGPLAWKAWEEFQYSVETGKPAVDKVFGMSFFDFLAQHADQAARFSETMVSVHGPEASAVAEAYDFSAMGVIVDVGGDTGNMLSRILARYPQPTGVLFDQPHVVTEAPTLLRARGVESRVTIERGSFFERVPA
jgi:hypothetical protein